MSLLIHSSSLGNVSEWILMVWYNGGRKRKLNQAEFIDMGPLSGGLDLICNFAVLKGAKSLHERLAKAFEKTTYCCEHKGPCVHRPLGNQKC